MIDAQFLTTNIENDNKTVRSLEFFFCENCHCKDIEQNVEEHCIDIEHKLIKRNVLKIQKIWEKQGNCSVETAEGTEIKENMMSKEELISHLIELEKHSFSKQFSTEDFNTFNLIQLDDLHDTSNFVEKFLDFTCNPTLHTCDNHNVLIEQKKNKVFTKQIIKSNIQQEENIHTKTVFVVEPNLITFEDYKLHKTYKVSIYLTKY